jgi:hypothetical protein
VPCAPGARRMPGLHASACAPGWLMSPDGAHSGEEPFSPYASVLSSCVEALAMTLCELGYGAPRARAARRERPLTRRRACCAARGSWRSRSWSRSRACASSCAASSRRPPSSAPVCGPLIVQCACGRGSLCLALTLHALRLAGCGSFSSC